jgi:hypothetical protein
MTKPAMRRIDGIDDVDVPEMRLRSVFLSRARCPRRGEPTQANAGRVHTSKAHALSTRIGGSLKHSDAISQSRLSTLEVEMPAVEAAPKRAMALSRTCQLRAARHEASLARSLLGKH